MLLVGGSAQRNTALKVSLRTGCRGLSVAFEASDQSPQRAFSETSLYLPAPPPGPHFTPPPKPGYGLTISMVTLGSLSPLPFGERNSLLRLLI